MVVIFYNMPLHAISVHQHVCLRCIYSDRMQLCTLSIPYTQSHQQLPPRTEVIGKQRRLLSFCLQPSFGKKITSLFRPSVTSTSITVYYCNYNYYYYFSVTLYNTLFDGCCHFVDFDHYVVLSLITCLVKGLGCTY